MGLGKKTSCSWFNGHLLQVEDSLGISTSYNPTSKETIPLSSLLKLLKEKTQWNSKIQQISVSIDRDTGEWLHFKPQRFSKKQRAEHRHFYDTCWVLTTHACWMEPSVVGLGGKMSPQDAQLNAVKLVMEMRLGTAQFYLLQWKSPSCTSDPWMSVLNLVPIYVEISYRMINDFGMWLVL